MTPLSSFHRIGLTTGPTSSRSDPDLLADSVAIAIQKGPGKQFQQSHPTERAMSGEGRVASTRRS